MMTSLFQGHSHNITNEAELDTGLLFSQLSHCETAISVIRDNGNSAPTTTNSCTYVEATRHNASKKFNNAFASKSALASASHSNQ